MATQQEIADLFDTVFLQRALEITFVPQNFIWSTLFKESNTSQHDFIQVDEWEEPRQVATYTSPLQEGTVVEDKEFRAKIFQTPYIKENKITTALKILKRGLGDSPYGPTKSPRQKAMEKFGRDTAELKNRVFRRIELQANECIFTGIIIAQGKGVNVKADFEFPAADNEWTVANGKIPTVWTNATADILSDIENAADLVQQNVGDVANICIMGFKLFQLFRTNDEIKALLDNRRVVSGDLILDILPKGVRYIGNIGNMDFYVYVEYYRQPDGTLVNMFNEEFAIVTSTDLRASVEYGAIQDLEFGDMETEFFMKSWIEEDPSVQILQLQSSPLTVHQQMKGVVVLKPLVV